MRLTEHKDRQPRRDPPRERRVLETLTSTNVVVFDFVNGNGRSASVALPKFKIAKPLAKSADAARKLLYTAILVSAALHAGVIAAMFMGKSGEQFGTLSDNTDTFSLSMEQSIVLESISTESVQMASAAAAASQAGSVQAAESKPQELAEVENDPLSDEPPPKPIDVAEVTPIALDKTDDPLPVIRGGGAEQSVSEIKAAEIAETEVKEMPEAVETKEDTPATTERKQEVEKEKKTPQQESHQQIAGSSTSRSNASQSSVSGRVSASRGNALTYGAMVRAQLAHNKPTGIGISGTVRVAFGIDAVGAIRYLKISESSGSAALDNAALAVVRKSAPFGQPPSEMTQSQLAYVIPFYFR